MTNPQHHLAKSVEISFKKKLLSNTFRFFETENQVGQMKEKTWSQAAEAQLYGVGYRLKTKGFLRQTSVIYQKDAQTPLATVKYHHWKSKATIEYQQRTLLWKRKSIWKSAWLIEEGGRSLIEKSKNTIKADTQEKWLLLLGFFIENHFQQLAASANTAAFVSS